MLLAATAARMVQLGIWRLLTGLGVGCILACTNVIASEYSSKQRRGLSIGIYTAGYGVGATLGGAAAVYLQSQYGWRSVFVFGGISTLSILVLLLSAPGICRLPRDQKAPQRPGPPQRIARKTGHPELAELQPTSLPLPGRRPIHLRPHVPRQPAFHAAALVGLLHHNVRLLLRQQLDSASPRQRRHDREPRHHRRVDAHLGRNFGAVLYGVVATSGTADCPYGLHRLSRSSWSLFISAASVLMLAFGAGISVGVLINGCIAGLYTLTPSLYPASVRSTGVGWGIGIGRIGAIIAPLITGALLDVSWSAVQLYLAVGAVVLISAVAVGMIRPKEPVTKDSSVDELIGV